MRVGRTNVRWHANSACPCTSVSSMWPLFSNVWNFKIANLHQFVTFGFHFVRNGCIRSFKIAILNQFLTRSPHFVRKGCSWLKIAILHQACDISLWRCIPQFYTSFLPLDRHFVRKCCIWTFRTAILHRFLAFGLHAIRKGNARPQKIRISTHLCASSTRDLRRGLPKDEQNWTFTDLERLRSKITILEHQAWRFRTTSVCKSSSM